MGVGYLVSGVLGGLVGGGSGLAFGHPVAITLMLYSLSGTLAMACFGCLACVVAQRD